MLKKLNVSITKKELIVYTFLIVVTLAVYWQVNQFDLVSVDDDIYVTDNSHVQSGITLEGLRWAFSTTYAKYWHPVTWFSLMLDYQIYGLNAGGFHVTNLIFHILSTLLLFWLMNRMTGAVWRSAFVAALFALHPLRVESVAWVAKRRDILCVFFGMLTLCLYVYYTGKPVIKRYLLIIFSFILALMSKPMVVTLPVIMILLDYWPLKRFESQKGNLFLWQLREKAPFFILSVIFSIITICIRHTWINPYTNNFPLSSRFANALISFIAYLEKTFWPHDMVILIFFPANIPIWQIIYSTLLIIIISVGAMMAVKRFPYLFVGWLWYSITIIPVLGIIQFGHLAMSDHHTYLPSIGIAIGLAWGVPLLFPGEDIRKKILFPVSIAVLAIFAVLTWRQCGYWKDNFTLFNHVLHVTKNSYIAHNNIGPSLAKEGKTEAALYHYNEAIRLNPHYADAYNNRGIAYVQIGQYKNALEDFNKSINLYSDRVDTYNNRGIAYVQIVQYKNAFEDFNKLTLARASAYNNRGVVYFNLGHYLQAIEDFDRNIKLKDDSFESYYNRGRAYARINKFQNAIDDYNKSISLKPDNAEVYISRGVVYFKLLNNERGCDDAQKGCNLGSCKLLKKAKNSKVCR